MHRQGSAGPGTVKAHNENQRQLLCMLLAVPVLRSTRLILPHEELCFDYNGDEVTCSGKRAREDVADSTQVLKLCYCGAPSCRKYLPCSK